MKTGTKHFALALMAWMWAKNGLNLSGSDLHVYAAIYGACYDRQHVMAASCSELAEVLGLSKRSVMSSIKNLEERELIYYFCSRPTARGGRRVRAYALNTDAMLEAKEATPCNRPDEYKLKVSEYKLNTFASKRHVRSSSARQMGQGAAPVSAPVDASGLKASA